VTDLITIFRTRSDVEASVVRGLLEAHGVPSVVSHHLPQSLFPMAVSPLGEIGIAVHAEDADEAQRIIESHRTELVKVARLRDEFEALQAVIGYRFRDRGLLEHAMTHTSRANEDVSGGDQDEGQKSKIKAAVVSTATLAKQAERLSLGDHLLLGRGEEKTGGRRKQALLADSYEALIAAIYLDGGIEHARAFVVREFAPLVEEARRLGPAGQDYKSALQELVQARNAPLPEYRLVGTLGPDHRKLFQVAVVVDGEPVAEATGGSKKEAEQEAARLAMDKLRN
jgi:ribonuclease III